jgi:hypothetical protein
MPGLSQRAMDLQLDFLILPFAKVLVADGAVGANQ